MSLYDAAKDVANILKKAGKIDEYQKILDLINDLFEKSEKIEKLKSENNRLKEQLKVSKEYEFKNNSYWNKESRDGPFCSRCFDKNKELIRIIPNYLGSNHATCPECNKQVNFTGRENPHIIQSVPSFR